MSLLNTITFFLSLASLVTTTLGAPTPDNVNLALKYAPQFRLQKDETFFPSTIEYFLAGPVTLNNATGPAPGAPSPLTDANIANMPNQGSGLYLTTDVSANINGFLGGQNPSLTQTTTYTFIAPKDNGVVDLYYWMFCPYNLGKEVPVLGFIGDHVGDWERITIRTINGTASEIDYHAHSDSGSGVIPYAQAPKFSPSSPNDPPNYNSSDPNARPIVYVANGSHGMWSSAGTFTYINAVIFQLQDVTSDGGVYWDTQNSLTTINYPDTYTDSLAWLNFQGDWGNIGSTSCWWYSIYNQCELTDGPNGPLRSDVEGATTIEMVIPGSEANSTPTILGKQIMSGPLSQTLAIVSTGDTSEYTIHLSAAQQSRVIAIEQRCATLNSTSTDDDTPPTYSYTSTYASVPSVGGLTQYTIALPACDTPSTVASYAAGSCPSGINDSTSLESDLSGCSFGTQRTIRAFSSDPSVPGIQQASAVTVNDLDNWTLS